MTDRQWHDSMTVVKLFTFLLAAILAPQPAYGQKRPRVVAMDEIWMIIEGESSVEEGRSGILFMSHPDNQAHPESMRNNTGATLNRTCKESLP